jgi:hypothetical protein
MAQMRPNPSPVSFPFAVSCSLHPIHWSRIPFILISCPDIFIPLPSHVISLSSAKLHHTFLNKGLEAATHLRTHTCDT